VKTGGDVTETFTVDVTLTDPCIAAAGQTKPTPEEVIYTITAPKTTVVFSPQFTSSPTFCQSELQTTGTYPGHTLDPDDQILTLPPITDTLDPVGPNDVETCFIVYDYSGVQRFETCVTTPADVRNPCINPDFVEIKCLALDPLQYVVAIDGFVEYDAHEPCNVVTTPIPNHSLCGDLDYVANFDMLPINSNTVMGYDSSTKQFNAETDDGDMVNK
jgi:hypothetical protein